MTDIINKCACTCHTDKYFDEPHIETCKRDGKNPNHPYTHPITPDTNDGLDDLLKPLLKGIDLHNPYPVHVHGSSQFLYWTFDSKELKAAINQYMLDTFMELITNATHTAQQGKAIAEYIKVDELRKAAQEKFQ